MHLPNFLLYREKIMHIHTTIDEYFTYAYDVMFQTLSVIKALHSPFYITLNAGPNNDRFGTTVMKV